MARAVQQNINTNDRRHDPRVLCKVDVEYENKGRVYKGVMQNMGVGGFYILSQNPPPPSAVIRVSFYSSHKPGHLNFYARVTRISHDGFGVKIQ